MDASEVLDNRVGRATVAPQRAGQFGLVAVGLVLFIIKDCRPKQDLFKPLTRLKVIEQLSDRVIAACTARGIGFSGSWVRGRRGPS